MKIAVALLGAALVAAPSLAEVVQFTGTPKQVGGKAVHPEARVTVDGREVTVRLSGAGVRKKTKAFLTFNVYVAANYGTDVAALRRNSNPLEGVRAQEVKVLRLTMLRSLSAQEVRASFEEALDMNGVNVQSEPIQNIFNQWSSGLGAGQTATIVGIGQDKLVIEIPGKTIRGEGQNLSFDFWKIWFGEGDEGIQALKAQLIGKDE